MRTRHRGTLDALFAEPTRSNVHWRDVESLLRSLGAEISEGSGSRIRVVLRGTKAVFHRPHPARQLGKPMVRSVRRFLTNAGLG